MLYFLDTNICIYLIKNKPLEVKKYFDLVPIENVGISSVVLSELSYGVHKSDHFNKNNKALQRFIAPFQLYEYGEKACDNYGRIRSSLERKGQIIGGMDLMIAAHALSEDAIVVTNNIKEFCRVEGLNVENWVH